MNPKAEFDWDRGSEIEQLHLVRLMDWPAQRLLAQRYDWSQHPEAVLGWITAQKNLDLASVLCAFFNGDPMRYNYVGKRDVPAAHRGECRLLDAILFRVNSGFYLPDPAVGMPQPAKLANWLNYQQEDADEDRVGRWVFDTEIVQAVMPVAAAPKPTPAPKPAYGPIGGWMQRVLGKVPESRLTH
jgi:hypothetical protein